MFQKEMNNMSSQSTHQQELNILYQDEWLVVVDKPAGHLVHPASEPQLEDQVVMKILRDQIGVRVNSIHRLDRPTCGVLLFGIEKAVTKALHHDLAQRRIKKEYWAVVEGVAPREWVCEEPIQKEEWAPHREARTEFTRLGQVEQKGVNLSLLRACPHTGRFHQIRRHLLHAGLPIVGDYRYAGIARSEVLSELFGTEKQMLLQAQSIEFVHPHTKETFRVEAPVFKAVTRLFGCVF